MKFCQIRYEGNLLAKMLLNCLNKNVYFSVQAAYIRKLQQQADSIKKLLKLLNSAGGSCADQDGGISNDDISRPAHPPEEEGYEQLWELGTNCNGEIPFYRVKYVGTGTGAVFKNCCNLCCGAGSGATGTFSFILAPLRPCIVFSVNKKEQIK